MPFVAALILSVALHVGLLSLIHKGGSEGDGDGSGRKKTSETVKVKLLDKPNHVEAKKVPPVKGKGKVFKKKELPPEQKVVEHKCDDFYYGVGIQQDGQFAGCRIAYVAKGYPADRAGMKVGDLIITQDPMCPGRGPEGTFITIKVMRGTQVITFTMVREKICTSPEK